MSLKYFQEKAILKRTFSKRKKKGGALDTSTNPE